MPTMRVILVATMLGLGCGSDTVAAVGVATAAMSGGERLQVWVNGEEQTAERSGDGAFTVRAPAGDARIETAIGGVRALFVLSDVKANEPIAIFVKQDAKGSAIGLSRAATNAPAPDSSLVCADHDDATPAKHEKGKKDKEDEKDETDKKEKGKDERDHARD